MFNSGILYEWLRGVDLNQLTFSVDLKPCAVCRQPQVKPRSHTGGKIPPVGCGAIEDHCWFFAGDNGAHYVGKAIRGVGFQ